MRKETRGRYIQHLLTKLHNYYEAIRDNSAADEKRANLEGYLQAGLITGAASKTELQAVIDWQHKRILGMTLEERREYENEPHQDELDWGYFDKPE